MARTIQGAKASVKLNGAKIAFASDVNVTHENMLQEIEVLDNPVVEELAELGHRVSFTVNFFKVDENSANLLGFDPRNIDDILSQPEMTMEVYDRLGDVVIYEIQGVKFEGGSGTLNARGVWQGTWNFKGKRGYGI